jgi:G3E family GTPase
MAKIRQIATEETADHIVIQAEPKSDLPTLAKTFTVPDDSGAVLSEVATLETMVTVIDARSLLGKLKTTSARDLIEQIEFANVIVLEGAAVLTSKVYASVVAALEALNGAARIVRSDDAQFALASLRVEAPFDLDAAQNRSRGSASDGGAKRDAAVSRFTYTARRPFHPTKLNAFLKEPWTGVLRVHGVFWLASRPEISASIDVAGGSRRTASRGQWWAAVPPEQHPTSPAFQQYIQSVWHPEFGDRYHEIKVVGIDLDEADFRSRLEQCLLTDDELNAPEKWTKLRHPFPWPKKSR